MPPQPSPPMAPPIPRAPVPSPRAPSGYGRAPATSPRRRPGRRLPGSLPGSVSAMDRSVLWLYLCTRVGLLVTTYCSAWLFSGTGQSVRPPSLLSRWQQWDWFFYLHIAQHGYFPAQPAGAAAVSDNREAFFPGFPGLLRAVHLVVPNWTAAGLLISFVAGAVAVLALARIAELELLPQHRAEGRVGSRAAFFLLLSPCALFLCAGYTESLFLAFALPCWLAARRGNWPLAGLLACGAAGVRVSGLFLAAAVVVQFALHGQPHRNWRKLPWLALPALPALLFTVYLHAHTGDWLAWKHAEERGWNRQFTAPWVAWDHTWNAAFGHSQTTPYAFMFQAELAAMAVGAVLVCVLVRKRRWAEGVYVALNLWALGTSYWYISVPRATLLWWPLWILLARWSLRRSWMKTAYTAVSAPLLTVLTISFTSGRWSG